MDPNTSRDRASGRYHRSLRIPGHLVYNAVFIGLAVVITAVLLYFMAQMDWDALGHDLLWIWAAFGA